MSGSCSTSRCGTSSGQLNYEPVEDIRIERGDMVRFECWWDRTLLYMPEPRYITWNEGHRRRDVLLQHRRAPRLRNPAPSPRNRVGCCGYGPDVKLRRAS